MCARAVRSVDGDDRGGDGGGSGAAAATLSSGLLADWKAPASAVEMKGVGYAGRGSRGDDTQERGEESHPGRGPVFFFFFSRVGDQFQSLYYYVVPRISSMICRKRRRSRVLQSMMVFDIPSSSELFGSAPSREKTSVLSRGSPGISHLRNKWIEE